MEKSEIKKRVIEIISDRAYKPVHEISENLHLQNDLKMDSLDCVELVMVLENKFSISIKDEKIDVLISVQDVIDEVINQLNK